MPDYTPARLVQIHLSENDCREGDLLYELVVAKCRELGLAGATVIRGLEGFGWSGGLHRPVVVTIVDSEEAIARALPALEAMVDTGAIASEAVAIRRVCKGAV